MKYGRYALLYLTVISASFSQSKAYGQNLNVITMNGNFTYELTDLQSIVFKNGIFIVKDVYCGDNYYSDFFTNQLNFGASEAGLTENQKSADLWSVSPNPTTDNLHLTATQNVNASGAVVSITGEVVRIIEFSGTELTLDVSKLRSGIYFVQLGTQTIKFIKE